MTKGFYDVVAEAAGSWLKARHSHMIPASLIHQVRAGVGVYIGCREDGVVDYVGSATRPQDAYGIANRIQQHSWKARSSWDHFWVVLLHEDTPEDVVHAIEGCAISFLRPQRNKRRHRPALIPVRGS